jgi:hypothetical protein
VNDPSCWQDNPSPAQVRNRVRRLLYLSRIVERPNWEYVRCRARAMRDMWVCAKRTPYPQLFFRTLTKDY